MITQYLNSNGEKLCGQYLKMNNDYNEKSIIGFACICSNDIICSVDLVTGIVGKDLVINDMVYNSFVFITLGSFGIAGAEKIMGKKISY